MGAIERGSQSTAAYGDDRLLIDKKTAARRLGVGTGTIRKAVREGQLPVVLLGGREWIPANALDRFLAPAASAQGETRPGSGPGL